ncbi:MAG: hypothetical protein JSU82_01035 [Rhodospirillales bacterium]|nr:MAG: hypothetical protein JSU82_01035 [Rhodospirillales bacterium]
MRASLAGALAITAVVLIMLPPSPARADRIDGNWCYRERHMSIDGPTIITPGGTRMTGLYDRHGFQYTVPDGEADAGARVDMIQFDDQTIQVTTTGAGSRRTEIWNRCDLTT